MPTNPARGEELWKRSSNGLRRSVVDSEGREWDVYEMIAPAHDRRGGCVLVFSSEDAVRRVRDYPLEWHQLEPQVLLFISERA